MTVYVVTAHNLYQGNQHSYVVRAYDNFDDLFEQFDKIQI